MKGRRPSPLLLGPALLMGFCAGCSKPLQPSDLSTMPTIGGSISLNGTVETSTRAMVAAPLTGILKVVLARDQMRVTSGQVLARMTNDEVVLKQETAERKLDLLLRRRRRLMDRARAPQAAASAPSPPVDLGAATAAVHYARGQLLLARMALRDRADLRAAVATARQTEMSARQTLALSLEQVKSVEAQLPIEEDRYQSVKRLYESQSISREELRTAEQRMQTAVTEVNTARAAYNRDLQALQAARDAVMAAERRQDGAADLKAAALGAEARYVQAAAAYRYALEPARPGAGAAPTPFPPPEVDALDSDIVQAQADLIAARQEARRLSIVAPIKGLIVDWDADSGQYVMGGQALGYVVNLDRLKVTADVRPAIGLYLMPGSPVGIEMSGPPRRRVVGKVAAISPIVDPQTETQKITITFANPGHNILPGTVVTILAGTRAPAAGSKGRKP